MDETIEELWKKFHHSKEEKGVLAVNSREVALSKQQTQFSILFKLQINKDFNKQAFKSTIQQLWRGSYGVTIKEVGNNLFLAIFANEEDMVEVLEKSPWSFDKRLLLQRFNGDLNPSKVIFQRSSFWIRVFNVHIKSMNRTIGIFIANEIGTPPLVDAPKSSLAQGPFLRI